MTLPLHRFLNYIYWWYAEKMDKDSREDFDEWLVLPIKARPTRPQVSRAAAPTQADLESEGQDFMAFMSANSGR